MGAGGADELLTKLIEKGERWDPVEEQSALAEVQAQLFAETFKPTTLSRYVLLSPLGAGGGGIVYAAYDPHLHRKVAVKVLRTGEGSTALASRDRLLREAQAIAQLSHPNVVSVYDVGTLAEGGSGMGDGVFMVMELIEGETVRKWLALRPREQSEILEVFIAAGRGLAAAHARGIIHRDVKPSNVLVGDDGRARVLDFGLARAIDRPDEDTTNMGDPAAAMLDHDLTDVGAVMGTPRYMAPEQHAGAAADARTDQFGFCATLYEALAGAPAFTGETVEELLKAKKGGPPMLSNTPRWLAEAVARGLQPNPDDRFPDMSELLAALGRDPARRRKRLFTGVAVAGLAAAIVTSGYLAADQPAACEDPSTRLSGIWDTQTKAKAESAFHDTRLVYAPDSWAAVARSLDDYAERWRAAHLQTCEATLVEGAQSPELMGLQMLCLDRQLESFRQLSALFVDADESVVRNAVSASRRLPAPERCMDSAVELEARLVDLHGEQREQVRALDDKLLRARVLADAGKYEQSRALVSEVLDESADRDAHRTQARAHLVACDVDWRSNQFGAAEEACHAALLAAERGTSDSLAFDALVQLARVQTSLKAHGEAEQILTIAEARLASIPPEARDELAEAKIQLNMGLLRDGQWREAEALEHLDRALALHESVLGSDHPDLVSVLNGLGMVAGARGRESAARDYYERAIVISERSYGPAHPNVGALLNNLGGVQQRMGELDAALAALSRSLEIKEAQLGPDSPRLVTTLGRLGRILADLGRPEEAIPHHERAVRLEEAAVGLDSHLLTEPLVAYAHTLRVAGRCDDAMVVLERAAKLLESEPDALLASAGEVPYERGKCLVLAGEDAEARAQFERVLEVETRQRGEESRTLAEPLLELAGILERNGDVPGARLRLERASQICAATEGDPALTSRVESALARMSDLDG